jgi:UDP-glucuronate 4-epimerase
MRALVTGATGFIGSHICRRLLESGHEVVGFDTSPVLQRVADLGDALEIVVGDVTDVGFLARTLRRRAITHIVHLAAFLPESALRDQPTRALATNGLGTNNVLDAALACDVRRVVYASSDGVCALGPEADAPVRPNSLYGTLKYLNEVMGTHYADNLGLSTIGLRFGVNFGPGGRLAAKEYERGYPSGRMFRVLEAVMLGESISCDDPGTNEARWIYVKDSARLVELASQAETEYRIVNVPGTMTSLKAAVNLVKSEIPEAGTVTFQTTPGEPALASHFFDVDPAEARDAVGFELAWPLREALLDYTEAVRSSPALLRH